MAHDRKRACRTVAGLVVATVAVATLACSGSSPTEPSGPSVIAVDVGGGPTGSGGQIIVRADACACNDAALEVVLDGASQAAIGCGEERVFVVAAGQHTLKIYSPKFAGALTTNVTVTASQGVVVRLSCR